MSLKAGRFWDVCATSLSSLCVLHCLGFPLLVVVLPILGQLGDSHAIHVGMVMFAVPVTLYVVWSEIMTHRREVFIGVALVGLSFLVLAVSVPFLHDFETPLTLLGGTMLAGAHIWRALQDQFEVPSDDV